MLPIVLFTLSLVFSSPAYGSKCAVFNKQPCYVKIDGTDSEVGIAECDKYRSECCVVDNQCLSKINGKGKKDPSGEFAVPNMKKVSARALSLFPPSPCDPPKFPTQCQPNALSRYVLEPPVNIPYCVRIPCTLDRYEQAKYEEDPWACGSQPGCYFDKELYEYRSEFGPSVLPGVPVCHLAIRRSTFHVQAQEVVKYHGTWNPYFTECTLETFDNEIRDGLEGCGLITLLKVFNVQPKMAGWTGITSYQCALMDACWRPGEGCFYPVSTGDVVVKSGQRFTYNRHEIIHGRPKCQNWDPRTPYSVLKSYHQCLSAGCSVDASAAMSYYNHLYAIGSTMSVEDHWQYWLKVEAGKIGSYNLETIALWNYRDEAVTPKPAPFPMPSVGGPPPPPGGGNIFSLPKPGFRVPPVPTMPSKKSFACGPIFRNFGHRPCSPPDVPDIHQNTYCPYQDLNVPRFPQLKGSFQGCCEINPCYLSKYDIRKMHSGPSYYYTEWSMFSPCSASCGKGLRTRFRRCVGHDEKVCTEPVEETQECENQKCGAWGRWSDWTPCASACGISSRKRDCQPTGARCEGEGEETRRCSKWC